MFTGTQQQVSDSCNDSVEKSNDKNERYFVLTSCYYSAQWRAGQHMMHSCREKELGPRDGSAGPGAMAGVDVHTTPTHHQRRPTSATTQHEVNTSCGGCQLCVARPLLSQ